MWITLLTHDTGPYIGPFQEDSRRPGPFTTLLLNCWSFLILLNASSWNKDFCLRHISRDLTASAHKISCTHPVTKGVAMKVLFLVVCTEASRIHLDFNRRIICCHHRARDGLGERVRMKKSAVFCLHHFISNNSFSAFTHPSCLM